MNAAIASIKVIAASALMAHDPSNAVGCLFLSPSPAISWQKLTQDTALRACAMEHRCVDAKPVFLPLSPYACAGPGEVTECSSGLSLSASMNHLFASKLDRRMDYLFGLADIWFVDPEAAAPKNCTFITTSTATPFLMTDINVDCSAPKRVLCQCQRWDPNPTPAPTTAAPTRKTHAPTLPVTLSPTRKTAAPTQKTNAPTQKTYSPTMPQNTSAPTQKTYSPTLPQNTSAPSFPATYSPTLPPTSGAPTSSPSESPKSVQESTLGMRSALDNGAYDQPSRTCCFAFSEFTIDSVFSGSKNITFLVKYLDSAADRIVASVTYPAVEERLRVALVRDGSSGASIDVACNTARSVSISVNGTTNWLDPIVQTRKLPVECPSIQHSFSSAEAVIIVSIEFDDMVEDDGDSDATDATYREGTSRNDKFMSIVTVLVILLAIYIMYAHYTQRKRAKEAQQREEDVRRRALEWNYRPAKTASDEDVDI